MSFHTSTSLLVGGWENLSCEAPSLDIEPFPLSVSSLV